MDRNNTRSINTLRNLIKNAGAATVSWVERPPKTAGERDSAITKTRDGPNQLGLPAG
jgi:hypothetical protein